ncbi:MAG: hypothetical protein HYX22_02410 [Candidatus Yanofskybacteria bacterium]|nr:hypothetical protein [Candidatus Yanofskybacteria bacterium]
MLAKIAGLVKKFQYHIFLAVCMVLIAVISYNLGQINSLKKTPITVREGGEWKVGGGNQKAEIFNAVDNIPRSTLNPQKLDTRVVASKNSDKYHYSWCSGGKRIKPENQIWFNSAQEAESRGYVLAGNCNK